MKILAHRGFWQDRNDQNSSGAIERAFKNGFGVETDLRDQAGEIVISHDCPMDGNLLNFRELLEIYKRQGQSVPLALNIKSDGLQTRCQTLLEETNIARDHIFFFDMSVPDALVYLKHQLPCYTRYSDEEPTPPYVDRAAGVWVDGFQKDCTDWDVFSGFQRRDLPICLVSPELHGRDHLNIWQNWRSFFDSAPKSGMICTDFPIEADEFFND